MFNILITSSSRKVSLIKSFEHALQILSLDGRVYAVDSSPLSTSLYISSYSVVSPKTDEKDYLDWLLGFCLTNGIRLIIPTRDEELGLFASVKDNLKKKGIYINVSSEQIIRTCGDKRDFCEYCKARSIPVPKLFKDTEGVCYPSFVKGRYGKGARFAFKVLNRHQLQLLLSASQELIIQEYIDWPEYTVDYFADFEGKPVSVVPRERILAFGGESFVGKTVKDKFIIDSVIDFGTKLGLVGHNTIQLFYNKGTKEIRFIEVNPRYGGGAALGINAGAHTPLFLIKLILNQPIQYDLYDFEGNMYMFRYTNDIFIKKCDLKR